MTVSQQLTLIHSRVLTLASHITQNLDYTDDWGVELHLNNLTVAKDGTILADEQGYSAQSGPGAPNSCCGGAGHGGYGGNDSNSVAGGDPYYDDLYWPEALGSGGGRVGYGGKGGGAMHLVVSETFTLSGTLSADGSAGITDGITKRGGGGSGGSIWIETLVITGSGTIRANGGNGGDTGFGEGGGGAGGCIAIRAMTNSYSGTIQVVGGIGSDSAEDGEYGTVYLNRVDPLLSTVTAWPLTDIVANGIQSATITVTLVTTDEVLVEGKAASLTIPIGEECTGCYINGDPFSDTQKFIGIGPTNANGVVTATLTATEPGTKTIGAWAGDYVRLVPTATVVFIAAADLYVMKEGPATAMAGTRITYTLTISNEGDIDAVGVVVTDTLPEGMKYITHTAPSSFNFVQAGQTLTWHLNDDLAMGAQVSFDLVVTATMAYQAQPTNIVTATTTSTEVDTSDNVDTAATTIQWPQPELEVTPSYSELIVQRGTTKTLTLEIENVGTADAHNVVISAPLHTGWITVTPTTPLNLGAGLSETIVVTCTPSADLDVGIYRDPVLVNADNAEETGAALSVRVVSNTYALTVSVVMTETSTPVTGASVYLVHHDPSALVTEGVTKTIHQDAWGQTDDEEGKVTLEGLETGAYTYTVFATGSAAATGVITVEVTKTVRITLTGSPLLMPEPFYPEIYVQPGETGSVEAAIRNVGQGWAENIQVMSPVDWIYVGVIGSASALTAGQAISVTIFARPPVTLTDPVTYHYVNVTGAAIPPTRFALTVYAGSHETGTLQLQVVDEEGAPLDGARVALVSQEGVTDTQVITHTHYASFVGETGAGGVATFEGIPAGRYAYHVDAGEYEAVTQDAEVSPGGTHLEHVTLTGLHFDVEWEVKETEITDEYEVTVNLTFDADRLRVLPLDVVADDCGEGGTASASGEIQVRNPSSEFPVNDVQVVVNVGGVTFDITSPVPPTLGADGTLIFPFNVTVPADTFAEGWVTASGDDVLDGRAPVRVSTGCPSDGGWDWGWGGGSGGVAVGTYKGPSPSFPNVESPPFGDGDGSTTVQLKLSQHAVLERQAFLAELALSNVITNLAELSVCITATDSSGVSRPDHFTITPTETYVDYLAQGGELVRQWTIVPADIDIAEPKTYLLQATIDYKVGDVWHTMTSLPETILVQPQPEVHIEYFMPRYVREGEAFLLGVQARNTGAGTARNLRIATAHPVLENQLEEPVSFTIAGTFENDTVQPGDMLLDFGDLPPSSTVLGGWMIAVSHHGRFTDLKVRCEHLDYKGMALSTLLYCDGGENIFDNDLQGLNGNECPDASACDKQGCIGGPINTRSGNYGYAVTDLSIPTAGAPLRLERNYNSSNVLSYTGTITDPLGPGWTHNYAMRLFPGPASGTFFTATITDTALARSTLYYRPYVTVRLPGGSWLRLADNGDGTYTPYPGAQTTLSTTTTGSVVTTYTLTSADQTVRVFDADGLLHEIRDRRGNTVTLSYDGAQLTRVEDDTGERFLAFEYDGEGRLIEVRDPIDRTVHYDYDADADNLTLVTDTLKSAWTYAYTSIPLGAGESITLLHEVNDPAENLVERTDYVTATVDGKTI
ncbi:MAG: DUF11 domain-containing protein [bacterium]|nr:DUF11 domain-containing protein [bacterium]